MKHSSKVYAKKALKRKHWRVLFNEIYVKCRLYISHFYINYSALFAHKLKLSKKHIYNVVGFINK